MSYGGAEFDQKQRGLGRRADVLSREHDAPAVERHAMIRGRAAESVDVHPGRMAERVGCREAGTVDGGAGGAGGRAERVSPSPSPAVEARE